SGIVACFALVGGFLLWRTPLAIIMQSFDFFVSVARAGLELNRLSLLEKQYQENCLRDKIIPDPDYLRILHAHQRYQYEFHGLAVMNNLILIVSILTILPCFVSISPLIPIFGALLALSASAIMNRESARIQKQRPKDDLNELTKHGFFKPFIPHAPTTNTNEHPLSLPGPLL
ncbi:MAG TPA: hypothetical protein PLV25_07790, partial [Opitutales bacterium]|nr:hypothetical protein [Opitutales bacterium]